MRSAFAALACLALLFACPHAPAAQLTPEQSRLNLESFDAIWTKIHDRHWDPTLGGVNWDAAHTELRPRVERARSMEEARAAMRELLARLKQSHFALIPSDIYPDVDGAAMADGTVGIDLRVLNGEATVVTVDTGSAAARAGVKPGWVIVSARGRELKPALDRIAHSANTAAAHGDYLLRRTALALISAPRGANVKLAFRDAANRTVEMQLEAGEQRGRVSTLGNLPPQHVWAEARRIERAGAVAGYAAFNLFLDPVHVMETFNTMMQSCLKQCDGIVIDLRGNPGGIGIMSMGIAGWFVSTPGQVLGTMYMRGNQLRFAIPPRAETYSGPLAILLDSCSASTSEILAGGMKDLGRARIFGQRSAGAALPSMIEGLPNGDGLQFAVANYVSEGGKTLEGAGVTPDVETPLDRQALLAGRDPALDAALDWIRSQPQRRARTAATIQ